MGNKNLLIPLAKYGSDPSEVAIPALLQAQKGFTVVFATPEGQKATVDPVMLTGKTLGITKSLLMARQDAVEAYARVEKMESFRQPLMYKDLRCGDFDGLLLPGGHDKRIREYLESEVLQGVTVDFFKQGKPVGAICHGVLLAARSKDPATGKSVLYDYKTTALLKSQELAAYNLTRLWLGDYYLTYPGLTVEDEVKSLLAEDNNFVPGPKPVFRDSPRSLKRGFALQDRNYVSARWPGDVYNFARRFMELF